MRTIGSTASWFGGQITEQARAVLAPNPGPMTLDGTNTWILGEPGSPDLVLVDPGPESPEHLQAVSSAVSDMDGRVAMILLTHGHEDHAAGAAEMAAHFQAPVLALDPAHRLGSEGLRKGQVVRSGNLEIHVVGTPGHSSDSLTFWLPEDKSLLTGDTILGRGTTVVAHPDGVLSDYLRSLERLQSLALKKDAEHILPGHGPALGKPSHVISDYLEHRQQRLGQVRSALEAGAMTAHEVVALVYADVPEILWPAAELSVKAQIDYLDSLPPARVQERPAKSTKR